MALNKFMHPRNIYKTPPSFVDLAKSYHEFNEISKTDVTGKVTIDFKDPHSLRVLTKCLLKRDFNLDVTIPEDRLVPTLPLRLNYILWVEDLIVTIGKKDNIRGVDIGTGACAVYPLLAAVKNKWQMVGTESDEESMQKAKENVERNNLIELIEVTKSSSKSLLSHMFTDENAKTFDFSMCNPPFYSNVQELCESRSPARLPPKNAFTGSPQELITDGGELVFCRKMIEESKSLQDKIQIFTTMVGHKYNLKELELDLKAEGIKHTSTEFCQGRVTRWGLAWTYHNFDIGKLVPPRDKARKSNIPMVYVLPEIPGTPHDIDNVSKKIKSMLQTLNINFKMLKKIGHYIIMDIVAMTNTWSSQRRKRRLLKRLEGSDCKRTKLNGASSPEASSEVVCDQISEPIKTKDSDICEKDKSNVQEKIDENSNSNISEHISKDFKDRGEDTTADTNMDDTRLAGNVVVTNEKHDVITAPNSSTQEAKLSISNVENKSMLKIQGCMVGASTAEPVVHAILKILKKDDEICMEIKFLNGSAGKEGLHQIVQYIKNNWK